MPTLSEQGHAMNVAHMDELLEIVLTFKYDPSPERLKPVSMKTMSGNCRNSISEVQKALGVFKTSVNAREPLFELMNRLSSRVLNILKSSDVSEKTVETCKSIVRKIQGRRSTPKRTQEQRNEDAAAGIEVREVSSSQRSYDNQLSNFKMLVEQLNNIPEFEPNETDLQKEALHKLIQDLEQKNAAVVSSRTALKDARVKRDNLMYRKGTGLVDVALDAKSYIKGAFGPSSAEFRKVQKLEFRKN